MEKVQIDKRSDGMMLVIPVVTERETERQRDRETERQRDRETEILHELMDTTREASIHRVGWCL